MLAQSIHRIKEESRLDGEKIGIEIGEERGEERGEKRGKKSGKEEILEKLLTLKFGMIPEKHQNILKNSEPGDLELMAERILTCSTIEGVFEGIGSK